MFYVLVLIDSTYEKEENYYPKVFLEYSDDSDNSDDEK